MNGESTDADVTSLSQSVGTELNCETVEPQKVNWGGGAVPEDMVNTYNLRYENCDLDGDKTAAALETIGAKSMVAAVEAEAKVQATPIREDDTHKDKQRHLNLIKRDEACALTDKNTNPIVVAVVDSGVDANHVDLKDSFYRNELGEVVGANFVGSGSYMNPDRNWDDGEGHGTHVAGLIAATANNGRGVVGVGACANVKIMPVRALNDEGSGSSIEIERAIKWAADNGAHIINLSLGHTGTSSRTPSFQRSLYSMLASRNIVVFAAAGNEGLRNGSQNSSGRQQWSYPASYDNVIAVAATSTYGSLSGFSNRGQRIDIAAPGASVLATTNDGSYGYKSGTSMASPVAAGAYALALAAAQKGLGEHTDKIDERDALQLMQNSILTHARLSKNDVVSGGVIDLEKIVQTTLRMYPAPAEDDEPTEPTNPSAPGDQNDPDPTIDPVDEEPTTPTPVDPVPEKKEFSFANLKAGQSIRSAQTFRLDNLPTGTAVVYLYWGSRGFSKIYTKSYYNYAQGTKKWVLFGSQTLTAFAVDGRGRVLGRTKVSLRGY
jgi:subtilisin family serine protease